ncbi:cysteine hydrolase family protein [Sutcliffiella halmapala]|uniref:cysteine hydrolase family protein n=1 Tax=Sutcliffiella halmapala TaxID=79882 RepID=UPI00099558AE|nr:cysteine hydrolase family protein [Sutcliffiella halmapala]
MKKAALLIIDVQKAMFNEENPVFNGEKLIMNLQQLVMSARKENIPIFYIQHNEPIGEELEPGSEAWEVHPGVFPTLTDKFIQKTTPDSFLKTDLNEELQKQNIGHLILAGIQSDLCVDTTCRKAFSLGYDVTLVTDAHSTWESTELSAQQIINHHNQVLRWFAKTKETKGIIFQNTELIR